MKKRIKHIGNLLMALLLILSMFSMLMSYSYADDYTYCMDFWEGYDGKFYARGWSKSKRVLIETPSALYAEYGTWHTDEGGGIERFHIVRPMKSGTYLVRFLIWDYGAGAWGKLFERNITINKPNATFDRQGGTGGTGSVSVDYSVNNPNISVPTKTGYDFQGYYTGGNGSGNKYWNSNGTGASAWWLTGSNTVYAYWTPKKFTVNLNNGGVDITTEGSKSATATYNAALPQITIPERIGYTFDGYWSDSTGGTKYYNADGTSAISKWTSLEGATFYAHWIADEYSIKYYDDGEIISDSTDAKISDVDYPTSFTYEDAVTLPVDVIKKNAIFNGWHENINLTGLPLFSWMPHTQSRLENQKFYAKWIEILGTRGDSEIQSFLASEFDNDAPVPTYSTADVKIYLDGTAANVNQVQLKKGARTYTMAGADGIYSYTTSDDVSGNWDIWVNGADSGENLAFGTPSEVNMVTISVTIKNDDVGETNRNVILSATAEADLTLSESNTVGVYTLQTFAKDMDYNVYVDGEDTGYDLNISNTLDSQCTVNYYTAVVNVKKDNDYAHIGAVELRNGDTVLTPTGTDGEYSLSQLKDEFTNYDVYVAGKDTGYDVSFTSNCKYKTICYYTVIVNTKLDDTLANISDVTLRDSNDEIVYTLNSSASGTYTYVLQEDDTEYRVFVGNDDTGRIASFTSDDRQPEAIDYYTVQVTTKKDNTKANIGTVELKAEDGSNLILLSAGTGVYELTKIEDNDTVYEVYVGGESIDETVKFTKTDKTCVANYTSLLLTTNLDDAAYNIGSVVLKADGIPDLTMTYDSDSQKYKAITCFNEDRDVYVNDSDTDVKLKVGENCALDYYTLSYNLDGGNGTVPNDTIYISGTEINLPEDVPTKEDNQFIGWRDTTSPIPNVFSKKVDGTFDSITIGATTHTLTAVWALNSSFEAKYKPFGSDEWTYSTAQYALEFAQNHLDNNYNIELQKNASVNNNTIVSSNANLMIPNGITLAGNITNNGIITLNGAISGAVTNAGVINGGGTINENDELISAGTLNNLINQENGVVCNCNVSVESNLGTLTDCRIISGTNITGTVNGTIFAEAGVTFDTSLNVRGSNGKKAVISLIGGGTITSTTNINTSTNFAGLMLNNDSHYSVQATVHLRNKLTITDNSLYADFFDFNTPTSFVYDNQKHQATFTNSRTAGIGKITKICYRMETGESTWSDWTETIPISIGTYQVKIDVADGEYYFGKSDVIDEEVWTFKIVKHIVALWKTTSKEYTGSQLDPDVELSGVESIHAGSVDLALNNEERKDAGTYQVSITLTGEASKWYEVTNPYSEFIINRAPVTFTVTNNIQLADGTKKQANVVASPNVDFIVSYYSSNGTIVNGLPSEKGSYDIFVELKDKVKQNYRVTGSADGKMQKIGTFKLYSDNAPEIYKISFDAGEGATGTKESMEAVQAKTIRILPDGKGFVNPGYAFAGWKYNNKIYYAGDFFTQPTSDLTLVAQWTKNNYDITGIVKDSDDTTLENAVVTLMSGARQIEQIVTDINGKFKFSANIAGKYDLVVNYNGITVTKAVEIINTSIKNLSIELPSGRTNSVVEVKPGTPEVIVGGLENSFTKTLNGAYRQEDEDVVASGGSVEFKLEVEQNSLPTLTSVQREELQKATTNIGIYLDLDLSKTVRDETGTEITAQSKPIYNLDQLLTVEIPLNSDLQDMNNYDVFRYHSIDGNAANAKLEKLNKVVESDNPTQEGFCVSGDKRKIIIYTKSFSLYAITYREHSSGRTKTYNTYNVVIDDTLNGYVSVDKDDVSVGDTVTITVKPNVGYTLSTLTVKDSNGNEIKLDEKIIGETYVFSAPNKNVTVSAIFVAEDNVDNYFVDVNESDYFYDAVNWAVENNITSGIDETHFGPKVITTRAQMVTFMWKASGSPEPKSTECIFNDVVKGSYYEKAVIWGYENGYIKGTGEREFNPKANVTRGQAVTFLSKMSDEANNLSEYSHNFEDVKNSDYYDKPVGWAAAKGITSGTDSTHFSPRNECKRSEVITFLYKFFNK